jgi:hypothetical protein
LRQAAVEFGVSAPSLKRRLAAINELPGTDGQYGTSQLLRALYGDFSAEKLRKLRADRELCEAKLGILTRDYLPRERIVNMLATSWLVIRRAIEGSSMSEADKRSILKRLAEPNFEELETGS